MINLDHEVVSQMRPAVRSFPTATEWLQLFML